MLDFVIVKATREKGYTIPMDNDVFGMVCVQLDDREQIYSADNLEDDEVENNLSGFF